MLLIVSFFVGVEFDAAKKQKKKQGKVLKLFLSVIFVYVLNVFNY